MPRGMYIAVEGGVCSGKSSVIKYLCQEFSGVPGSRVHIINEPGTPVNESMMRLLVSAEKAVPDQELLMKSIERSFALEHETREALDADKIVISDGLLPCLLAREIANHCIPEYQESLRLLDMFIRTRSVHTPEITPDLVIWLKIPPEISLKRQLASLTRKDLIDRKEIKFHERVHDTLGRITNANNNWQKIIANRPLITVRELTLEKVRGSF